jgi:hypothetical protein
MNQLPLNEEHPLTNAPNSSVTTCSNAMFETQRRSEESKKRFERKMFNKLNALD